MKTRVILSSEKDSVVTAVHVFHAGGIVAFPTDTVYGVGASAFQAAGIESLFKAKGRDFNKAIAVLISDLSQLVLLTSDFNQKARQLAERFWPGALTLIVTKLPTLPGVLSQTATLGIRMPDSAFTRKLIAATGPLATTSANLSGGKNPLTAHDVLDQLDGRINLLIDGGTCPGGIPSTVVDCTLPEPKVLRQGSITEQEIKKALS